MTRALPLILLAAILAALPAHALTITKSGTVIRNQVIQGDLSIQNCSDVTVDGCTFPTAKFLNVGKWSLSHVQNVRITNCSFPVLGRGVTGATSHISEWWNCDGIVFTGNKVDITIESGLDVSAGGEWHFDDRNRTSSGNVTRIHCKRASYAIWRWRGDHSTNVGSFGNTFTRDTLIIDGVGGQLLPSSSADCGYGNYDAQCVGAWNWTMTDCLIDASACTGPVEMVWQGGMHGLTVTGSTFNVPVRAFDLAGSRIERTRIKSARWTDEFSRPVVARGLALACVDIPGGATTASKLAAAGSVVTLPCTSAPPAAITDLATNDGNATPLRWTAPAGAVRYECERSGSPVFASALTEPVALHATRDTLSLPPLAHPGKRDSAWVRVPGTGRGVFYRLYSVNAAGQRSAASNIAVKIERPFPWAAAAAAAAALLAAGGGALALRKRGQLTDRGTR